MLDWLPDLYGYLPAPLAAAPFSALLIAAFLIAAGLAFVVFFLTPWFIFRFKLQDLSRQLSALKQSAQLDPHKVAIKDRRLAHLWQQYLETLHLPQAEVNPRTGVARTASYRATIPAEVIFNAQSVYEGRIHTEFFKHLPGLLTGLGIIATFAGLIHGLGAAMPENGPLNTTKLINSVREAFYVSAAAISFAMIITFVEKLCVANLHRVVEQLCQQVDSLYSGGAGEEYLSRLVHASEESSSQARILKDALVGELSAILERLSHQQISAAATQQVALQQHIVQAIDRGLGEPLGELAKGFGQFRAHQGDQLTQGLQDSMAAFADKLDKLLGGQVGQARELQQQTVTALARSVTAFEGMARQISDTGTAATTAMSSQLDKAMVEMADAQQQMNSTMRSFVDEMRSAMRAAQEDTQGGIAQMLSALSTQVDGALQAMSQQSAVATVAHEQQLGRISQSTSSALDELANLVRDQTAALQQATSTMRSAVSELGASVDRNIAKMGQGAEQMRQAADAFSGSGRAIADVFDRSRVVSAELSQVATQLSASSNDVQAVVGDYRAARESFVSLVEGLRGTVDTAKREVALTQDLVGRLESAAQKLFAAQGHADGYLDKLNQVLAEAHGAFSSQMLNTVRTTNGEFHDSLRKATGLLATTIVEFENALGDNTPRTRRAAS